MAVAMGSPTPVITFPAPAAGSRENTFHNAVWHAPLVPAALSLTAGIVIDRHAGIPLTFSLVAAAVALAAWALTRTGLPKGLPLVYLAVALAAFGAAYHHWHRAVYRFDDIGHFAAPEPRPAHLYGVLVEEPYITRHPPDPLESFARSDTTVAVLQATHLMQNNDWHPVSGRARLVVTGKMQGLHVGDDVEAVGRLVAPRGPANPGELDYASFLQDQRIRAMLQVRTPDGVTRTAEGWLWSPGGWLAVARGWGQRTLEQALPKEHSGVAMALLLGEGSTMSSDDWQQYIRTGVIYVLAISGQHLLVLAGFLWGMLRLFGVRRRRGAWVVALQLLTYALLAGGRPPVIRAAVMVTIYCLGIFLHRPAHTPNSFALAWIAVAVLNPADLFNTGCQLSFLAVAVLFWGTSRWFRVEPDAIERMIDAVRPAWQKWLRWLGRTVALSYAITAAIWLALAPLMAARYHLISPVAILIGPPMVLLTSAALISGFLLLLASLVCWPLVPLFAGVTSLSLACCDLLVHGCDRPSFIRYVGDVPEWWLWGFYPALLAVLMLESLRRRWNVALLAGLAWLCVGLIVAGFRPASDAMRCTFLAVGHGGCTVIETPEGRTLLVDAGALGGPEVTRRQIAPFLWRRGIRKIDEVFLSHADLDHFNGLPALLERFAVGQVSCTPTFADKNTPGVSETLDSLERHRVPRRILRAGDHLASGSVEMEVLHPPAAGPEGIENVRSLVLLVKHAGHSLLLTGDLEREGLDRVLSLPARNVDVLMAPHHGSRGANTPELAAWARPLVVVSCQGPPRGRTAEPYSARGALFLPTWTHGAVTIHSRSTGLEVETFQSGKRFELR